METLRLSIGFGQCCRRNEFFEDFVSLLWDDFRLLDCLDCLKPPFLRSL